MSTLTKKVYFHEEIKLKEIVEDYPIVPFLTVLEVIHYY